MDIRKIKKLIEIIEESGIAEIEIKEGEEAIRISRYSAAPAAVTYAPASSYSCGHRRKSDRLCR
jgi:acetyl-CoA carboxylase biotin carboxyl carrier protein